MMEPFAVLKDLYSIKDQNATLVVLHSGHCNLHMMTNSLTNDILSLRTRQTDVTQRRAKKYVLVFNNPLYSAPVFIVAISTA